MIAEGDNVLSRTPEMLPVLKEAGVVDSGGQGLMEVMRGARDGLLGKEVEVTVEADRPMTVAGARSEIAAPEADIRFGYCTEFIINLEKPMEETEEDAFKAYLESIGDSIVVVADDDLVKVHVHTNHPGLAFEKALTYGSLSRMKIDNMREEHHERLIQNAEKLAAEQKREEEEKKAAQSVRKPYGFIAVSVGDGLGEIFKGIGADCLIEGGQTMNPSTEDVLNAVDQVNADVIFVLPNNKNIILAAEQAASPGQGQAPGGDSVQDGSPGNHSPHQLCPRSVPGGEPGQHDPGDGRREDGTGHLRGEAHHHRRQRDPRGRYHGHRGSGDPGGGDIRPVHGPGGPESHDGRGVRAYKHLLRQRCDGGGGGEAPGPCEGGMPRLRGGAEPGRSAHLLLFDVCGIIGEKGAARGCSALFFREGGGIPQIQEESVSYERTANHIPEGNRRKDGPSV